MKQPITQNNFYAYLLLLVAFFVLLFFTRWMYGDLQVSIDESEQKKIELSQLEQEHSNLTELKNRFDSNESEILEEIAGFTGEFSDKDILEYIHSYAEKINAWNERLIVRDITLSWGNASDLWFQQAEITVSAVFSWEDTLFRFLDYLTDSTGKYKFYITNFNYPMNQVGWNVQVSIPLTLYYQ